MSRGPGRTQRRILEALEGEPVARLSQGLRHDSEYVALHRAARTLARRGSCQVCISWDDSGTKLVTYVARPNTQWQDFGISPVGAVGERIAAAYNRVTELLGFRPTVPNHPAYWRARISVDGDSGAPPSTLIEQD